MQEGKLDDKWRVTPSANRALVINRINKLVHSTWRVHSVKRQRVVVI